MDALNQGAHDQQPPSDHMLQLPAEKAYFLQRTQVLLEVQTELLAWAKGRFWVITTVALVVGVLGGSAVIKSLIDSQVNSEINKEVQRLQLKLDELREATTVAKVIIQNASSTASKVDSKLSEQEKKSADLEARASSLTKEFSGLTASGFRVSADLRLELNKLSSIVKTLAERQGRVDDVAGRLVSRVDGIQEKLAVSEKTIAKEQERADLTKYPIRIATLPGFEGLEAALRSKGYSVSTSPTKDSPAERPGIGLSEKLPVELAVDIVRTVRSTWPHLRFVYASDIDGGTTTLIGGVREVLERMGYRELSEDEIRQLLNPSLSREAYTAKIKSFRKKA
jgi:hypothetical protein